jgi:hypothetical protein
MELFAKYQRDFSHDIMTDDDISARLPGNYWRQEYNDIYLCTAWPYWFGFHYLKPFPVQLQRLQDKHPHLRLGTALCAAIPASPTLPTALWRSIHRFLGDDLLQTMALAIHVARHRHTT